MARNQLTEIEGGITWLLVIATSGTMESDDPQLKGTLVALKTCRAAAQQEAYLLAHAASSSGRAITPRRIEKLGALLRRRLAAGDPAFRMA